MIIKISRLQVGFVFNLNVQISIEGLCRLALSRFVIVFIINEKRLIVAN